MKIVLPHQLQSSCQPGTKGAYCAGEICNSNDQCYNVCCDPNLLVCVDNSNTCIQNNYKVLVIIFACFALLLIFCLAIFCLLKCKESSENEARDDEGMQNMRQSYREYRSSVRRSTMRSIVGEEGLVLN